MKIRSSGVRFCVRQMTWDDCEAVRELCATLGYPSSTDEFRIRLADLRANSYHEAFVAESADKRIIGWLHVYEVPALLSEPTAELGGLVVAAEFRQQGVGRALLDAAQIWAQRRGKKSLLLATRWDRADAKAFYTKLGFGTDYDATYLRRAITPRAS